MEDTSPKKEFSAPIITPESSVEKKMTPARIFMFAGLVVAAIVILVVLITENKSQTETEGLTLEEKTELYNFLRERSLADATPIPKEVEASVAESLKDNGIEASKEQVEAVSKFFQQ